MGFLTVEIAVSSASYPVNSTLTVTPQRVKMRRTVATASPNGTDGKAHDSSKNRMRADHITNGQRSATTGSSSRATGCPQDGRSGEGRRGKHEQDD